MNNVMESIQQLSGPQAELKTLKDRLNGKIDVILSAATQLSAGGQITVLQSAIGELVIVPSYTYAGKYAAHYTAGPLERFRKPDFPLILHHCFSLELS